MIDRLEGASSRFGFSTILVMEKALPCGFPTPTTPYMCTRSGGTSSTAMILARSERRVGVHHLLQAAAFVLHQHVRQQQRKRLWPHQFACAPDRMAEAERRLLAGKACGARAWLVARKKLQVGRFAALLQCHFKLELAVEVVFDHPLVAARHKDEMLDARLPRLIHHVLDQWPVHDRQHFLRHGLGGREEPRAQAGHGENSFTDGFHGVPPGQEGL